MKNKPNMFKSVRAAVLPLVATLAITGSAHAADRYWDNNGGTANLWSSVNNWSTVVGGGTSPAAIPTSSDLVIFSATPIQGTAQNIYLTSGTGNGTALGLSVLSGVTENITILGSTGGTGIRTLTVAGSGIVNDSNKNLTIGTGYTTTPAPTNRVDTIFNASASVKNNGSGEIVFTSFLRTTAGNTVTFDGTGSGIVRVANVNTASNSGKIVMDTSTHELYMRGAGLFSGGLEIKKGLVFSGAVLNNSLGTGGVTLGGTGDATLRLMSDFANTYANAITLAGSGALKIQILDDGNGQTNSHTFTGGITGTNDLTIDQIPGSGDNKDDTITFSTGAINHTGSLTHTGTAEGNLTINSAIGTNVTAVTQNSATSKMVLNAVNTYSGVTTVQAGTLYVGGELSNSFVTVESTGTIGSNGANGVLGNGLTIDLGGNLDLTGATLGATSSGILSITGGGLTLGGLTFQDITGWDWANAEAGTYQLIAGDFTVDWGDTAYLDANTAYDFGNGKKGYFEEGSLNVVIIPEPGAALLGGLGLLALLRRRR